MNNYSYDQIDAIMTLAMAEYSEEITNRFLNAKPDFEVDGKVEQHILQMIRKDKHRTSRQKAWRVFKYVMVAILIVATVAFSACMAFPRIREAIWKAIVEWHDDYVAIKFVPIESEDSNASTSKPAETHSTDTPDKPNDPIILPPTSIEEVNVPEYMPMGYTTESTLMDRVFILNYFDEKGAFVFSYRQMVIDLGNEGDAEEGVSTETMINGLSAVVITYDDEPNVYNLFWQDSQYCYNIYGYFEEYNELIEFATSVEVK